MRIKQSLFIYLIGAIAFGTAIFGAYMQQALNNFRNPLKAFNPVRFCHINKDQTTEVSQQNKCTTNGMLIASTLLAFHTANIIEHNKVRRPYRIGQNQTMSKLNITLERLFIPIHLRWISYHKIRSYNSLPSEVRQDRLITKNRYK